MKRVKVALRELQAASCKSMLYAVSLRLEAYSLKLLAASTLHSVVSSLHDEQREVNCPV